LHMHLRAALPDLKIQTILEKHKEFDLKLKENQKLKKPVAKPVETGHGIRVNVRDTDELNKRIDQITNIDSSRGAVPGMKPDEIRLAISENPSI